MIGVGYLREVPMSKLPIFADFDVAEILMLTASVLVVASVTKSPTSGDARSDDAVKGIGQLGTE
jgi:hypothetical protein